VHKNNELLLKVFSKSKFGIWFIGMEEDVTEESDAEPVHLQPLASIHQGLWAWRC
jgi:hypothetical protein